MSNSSFGFTPEEMDSADTITAVLAHNHEAQSKRATVLGNLVAAYGIVLAGRGIERVMWGGGPMERQYLPFLGHGVMRLIRENIQDRQLVIYSIPELWDYVGDDGYVGKAKHQDRRDWAILREAMAAREAGLWVWRDAKNPKHPAFKSAHDIAANEALRAALECREKASPSFSCIPNGGFEYASPDPYTITVEGPQ